MAYGFLITHWKTLAAGIALLGAFSFGLYTGSGYIQDKWDAERMAAYQAAQLKQAEWNQTSAAYQQELAKQRATIETNRRKINELSKKYNCIAGDDISGLWSETFRNREAKQ